MTAPTSVDQLRTILAHVTRAKLPPLGLDDDLVRDLGLDSLTALRILALVEKRYGVRFPDDRLSEFRTLRQLREFVEMEETS